ncbi:MAG: FAD-binding oxidoreductase, partial [Sandaracinobacteroides sp.]
KVDQHMKGMVSGKGSPDTLPMGKNDCQSFGRHEFEALHGFPGSRPQLLQRLRAAAGETVESFELVSAEALAIVLAHRQGVRAPLAGNHAFHVLIDLAAPQGVLEEVLAEALLQGEVADAVIAASEAQADAFWHLRETIPEAEKREGGAVKNDISVAVADLPAFHAAALAMLEAEFPGSRPLVFGHLGDGNLHWNFRPPAGVDQAWLKQTGELARCRLHDLVAEFRGSISAEHGIGTLKAAELQRLGNPAKLAAMRAIKQALDPQNILNPGKLFV